MAILSADNITFAYPDAMTYALDAIDFSVGDGEFIVLCGPSGSGKSTLLRLCKHDIAPYGTLQGNITYKGIPMDQHLPLARAQEIGMVFQDPEHQIVMDNVMDELLFGLENTGASTPDMRKRVAEMVHFFDVNHLLGKQTYELSGGEKQLINLASVLLLDPDILLLDEPTGQLDPIASKEFIHTIERLNDEFGITVIIAEHRFEELFPIADRIMVLEDGRIGHFDTPRHIVGELALQEGWHHYLPSTSKLYTTFQDQVHRDEIPLTVKETKQWLQERDITRTTRAIEGTAEPPASILQLKAIDFQYDPHAPLVLDNLSMTIARGEWHAILGANGTGKSSLLQVINGILKPQHGHLKYNGKKQKKLPPGEIGYLPQRPALFFVQDSLMKEYLSIATAFNIPNAEERIHHLLEKMQLESFRDRHPYDLSGGQLQKAALVGSLLIHPSILLIDEPTKGLDPESKEELGNLLQSFVDEGLTIVMVTHDVEFAAAHATRCSMLFRGAITVTEATAPFFRENMYYTTVMNRITRKTEAPPVVTLQEAKETWQFPKNT